MPLTTLSTLQTMTEGIKISMRFALVYVGVALVFGLAISGPISWTLSQIHMPWEIPPSQTTAPAAEESVGSEIRYIEKQENVLHRVTDPVALVTLLLAIATFWTATIVRAQVRLAREEFIATHRPRLIVHAVGTTFDVEGAQDVSTSGAMTIGASVAYFNIGETSAQIVEVSARMTRLRFPLQSGVATRVTHPSPREKIAAGEKGTIPVTSTFRWDSERLTQQIAQASTSDIVCIGRIVYKDDGGTSRETGFCWRFDVIGERWFSVEISEYQYAY
jgi:hypothetical protein